MVNILFEDQALTPSEWPQIEFSVVGRKAKSFLILVVGVRRAET
jgi:hypothetical protein